MTLPDLSPEAHGTLMALGDLRHIRSFDDATAKELTERGFAKVASGELHLTDRGHVARRASLSSKTPRR